MFNDMEDMAEFKWSIVVVLLIYSIHITRLKLLYDVELTKQIHGYQKANHFFFFFKKLNMNCLVLFLVIWARLKPRIN